MYFYFSETANDKLYSYEQCLPCIASQCQCVEVVENKGEMKKATRPNLHPTMSVFPPSYNML